MYHDISCHRLVLAYNYAYILNIFCLFTCVDLVEGMYVALPDDICHFLGFYSENYIGMQFPMIIPNPPVFAFYILHFSFTIFLS